MSIAFSDAEELAKKHTHIGVDQQTKDIAQALEAAIRQIHKLESRIAALERKA